MADKTENAPPEFALFHAPILSFYAGDLYRDAAAHWKGSGVLYMMFLCAVLAVPDAARLHVQLSRALDGGALRAVENMPPLVVKDGVLTVDRPQPFELMTDPETHSAVVMVDTTGTLTTLEGSSAVVLLTRDKVMMKSADGSVQSQQWKDIGDLTLDAPTVLGLVTAARRFMVVAYYPLATLFSFAWMAVVVMLLTLAARLMVARAGKQLPAPVLHRLTALALTPAMVTTTVLTAFGVSIPAAFLLRALMTMGYMTFALSSVLDPDAGRDDDDDD